MTAFTIAVRPRLQTIRRGRWAATGDVVVVHDRQPAPMSLGDLLRRPFRRRRQQRLHLPSHRCQYRLPGSAGVNEHIQPEVQTEQRRGRRNGIDAAGDLAGSPTALDGGAEALLQVLDSGPRPDR